MALTDITIKKATPKDKLYRLSDADGLCLEVAPTGGKRWRFRYCFDGKEKMISLGTYPEVSLAEAREKRFAARKLVAAGIDPSADRKTKKATRAELLANSFESIGREWYTKQVKDRVWTADHAATNLRRLEKDIFPWIGSKPVTEVTAKDIRAILDRIRSRGVIETARRARTLCGQIFVYAISTDRAQYDIAASLKTYLPPTSKTKKHMASVTDPKELAPLLRAMDAYQGGLETQCALKLLPMLLLRPGELRHIEWAEIDFENAQINIPANKMKMRQPHTVPLSSQAVSIFEAIKPLTGHGKYVFPSVRSAARPISDNTLNAAFRRMGYSGEVVTGHGFRATARTILDEVLGFPADHIEHQLAHAVRDANGRAYNRTSHLTARQKMMQQWSDYLDGLKAGAKILPLQKAA